MSSNVGTSEQIFIHHSNTMHLFMKYEQTLKEFDIPIHFCFSLFFPSVVFLWHRFLL